MGGIERHARRTVLTCESLRLSNLKTSEMARVGRLSRWYDRIRLKVRGLHLVPAFGSPRGASPFGEERMPGRSRGLAAPKAGPGGRMSAAKEELTRIIAEQPDDSTHEELVRELAFRLMVRRGLDDSDAGRTISNEEMRSRIRSWPD